MCAGGKEDEFETFKRLITEVYPSGFVSIVSDTWDYWKVITDYLPRLKDEILARDGRVVIRPDKGYKVLDPHIGIIYGDSIDLAKEKEIYRRLEEKKFAATNLVLWYCSRLYQ